jgi:hypothetical protein
MECDFQASLDTLASSLSPSFWYFEATNSTSWTTLDIQRNQIFLPGQIKEYFIGNNLAYTTYRWTFLANNRNTSASNYIAAVSLAEATMSLRSRH